MLDVFRSFGALFLGTFLMTAGAGLAGVLIPLRAAAEGWSSAALAWIGTSYAVAFTAGCLLTPVFVRRVGHIRVFAAMQTSLASSLLLLALIPDPVAWALLRAVGGLTLVGSYMVVESWINERTGNENRGTVFSAYMIVSMSGIAAGQFALPAGTVENETLFMIAALAFAIALVPVVLSTTPSPPPPKRISIDIGAPFRKAPAAAVGSILAGAIYSNWSYFGPLYGREVDLSSAGIAMMLTAAMVGGVVFQMPLGRLSDRIDRRYVMAIAGAIGVLVCLCMIVAAPRSVFGVVLGMFALGSVLLSIYSLNVAHANDQAGPSEFVQVSGGLLVVYGIGNMIGPQLGGRLMDRFGPEGFFVAMGSMYAVYGGYALWRSTRKVALPPELRPDFSAMPALPLQSPATIGLDARASMEPVDSQDAAAASGVR